MIASSQAVFLSPVSDFMLSRGRLNGLPLQVHRSHGQWNLFLTQLAMWVLRFRLSLLCPADRRDIVSLLFDGLCKGHVQACRVGLLECSNLECGRVLGLNILQRLGNDVDGGEKINRLAAAGDNADIINALVKS